MSETKSSRGSVLTPPLARALRSTVNEAAVQRMWSGIERRLSPERAARPARPAWLALAALLVACSVGLVVSRLAPWRQQAEPRALVLADGRAFDSIEGGGVEAGVVRFSDGSRIEAEPGARVEALASTPSELSLLVRRGRARFFVTPGGPRRWSIDARGVRVEVVGTVLTVEAGERVVSVAVEVGAVLVRSPLLPDGVQRIAAGQDVQLVLEEPEPAPREAGIEAEPRAEPEPAAPPQHARKPLPRARKSPSASSSSTAAAAIDPARELWARADAARAAGEPELAIQLLEQLLREHSADAQAPLGAFTLGTVLAEQQQPERAARAFRLALELGLPSVLRELCLRRLAELERGSRAGDEVSAPR